MQAALLTLMLLPCADASSSDVAPIPAPEAAADAAVGSVEAYGATYGEGCGATCGGTSGAVAGRRLRGCIADYLGPMPQTCYGPRYGCYPGASNRHLHRYPAFHGTYYRRPYNYRNLFDYPWHARLHEPTSLFSYNVAPPTGDLDRSTGETSISTSRHRTTYPRARQSMTRPGNRVGNNSTRSVLVGHR